MRKTTGSILIAMLAAVIGCVDSATSNGDDSGGTDEGDLTFLRLAAGAPVLCADSAGAWFTKDPNGDDEEIALEFDEEGGTDCTGETEDFLRLRIRRNSLLRRPDGTLISNGDSIFISVKWVGNDSILFELKPSGLQFSPADPAELKIDYSEAGPDLDGDGDDDEDDDDVEDRLDIWRQELPGQPFIPVGFARLEDEDEIDARLIGFSRFALAY